MVFKENILSTDECRTVLKRYSNSDELQVLTYEEKPLEELDGYFKIKIKILNGMQSEIKCIGKILNSDTNEIFSHELYADCDFTPKYYYGKEDKFIIFEDFSNDFLQPSEMDMEHLKLTLKTLAAFHSRSMEFETSKFKKEEAPYKKFTRDPLMNAVWFQKYLNNVNHLIDLFSDDHLAPEEFKAKIAKIRQKFHKTDSKIEFKKALCHGGLWDKNILFKYDNKKPVQCKFINFEYQHYNSPVVDVLQFIYMNTNQETRKQYLDELLDFYYECLKLSGLNTEKIIPKNEDYYVSIYYFLPLIKLQRACFQQIQYLHKDYSRELINTNNSSERLLKELKTNQCLKEFITESIMELKDLVIHPGLMLEDCFKVIKNKIGTTNYRLVDYKIIPLGKISGYLGDHNKLKIEIIVNNEKKILNLFAKFMPFRSTSVAIEEDTNAFFKEIFFYQQLVPMTKSYGIDLLNECVVPCYFARHKHVIIFDDMETKNYLCLDPRKPISFEFAGKIIKKLAKLHASSTILEEKIKEETNTKYSFLDDFSVELREALITQDENHQGGQCMKTGIHAVDHMMELFPDVNKNSVSKEEMRTKIKKVFEVFYEVVKPSKEYRNVICHGDLWITNMLIQCFDGKLTDCRFIDFQLCRYCPPAQDLLTFIYLTTNRELRKRHFSDLIELYYAELSRNIGNYGYDIDRIYPYEKFMKSIEYTIPQAVCQTVFYFQLVLINPDIIKDYMANEESTKNILVGDRRDFLSVMYEKDPLFRERASECIQDLRDMCMKYF